MLRKSGVGMVALVSAGLVLSTPGVGQTRGGTNAGTFGGTTWRLSGNVVMEDGSLPNQPVKIESLCGGTVRKETTVDAKGGFGFVLGQGSGDNVMEAGNNASHETNAGFVALNQCSIRAALPGYTSDAVSLVGHESQKPDLGTIVLHKNADGRSESPTSKAASKDARKAFEKGGQSVKANHLDEAAASFQQAVKLSPNYAEAWCELGKVQLAMRKPEEARQSLQSSVQADDKYIPPYLQLAGLELGAQNFKAVADVTDRVLKLAPFGYPQMYMFNAMAYFRLQNLDAAEKSARAGIEMDKQYQAAKLYEVLASVLSMRGDFAGAAMQLRKYLEIAPTAGDAALVRGQITDMDARAAHK